MARKRTYKILLSDEDKKILNATINKKTCKMTIQRCQILLELDENACAYHRRTGIAGYTLVYNSRGLILRTHQPFESVDKAIHEDEDIASKSEYIYTAPQRILVRDTDEGGRKQALIRDLTALVEAYQSGVIAQGVAQEM